MTLIVKLTVLFIHASDGLTNLTLRDPQLEFLAYAILQSLYRLYFSDEFPQLLFGYDRKGCMKVFHVKLPFE